MSTVRLVGLNLRKSNLVLAVIEISAIVLSLFLATLLTSHNRKSLDIDQSLTGECLLFAVVVVICFAGMGMYHSRLRSNKAELLARIILGFALASLGIVILDTLIPNLQIGLTALSIAMAISFTMVCGVRYVFFRVQQTELMKRRVLVLGVGERASLIHRRMRRAVDRRGITLMGFVPLEATGRSIPPEQVLDLDCQQIDTYARREKIDEIVVASDQRRGKLPMDTLYRCRIAGIQILDVETFMERELGKLSLKGMYPSWLIYADGYRRPTLMLLFSKRLFDLITSTLLLTLMLPVMLFVALLIKGEGGPAAPVFYTQQRVGLNGRLFSIFKFRSMRTDAEANGAVWAQQNDTRVTPIGAFMRKYRIDELPQLINILKGDMSFVGPRPERPEFVDELAKVIPYYGDRHQVKPGLTGWAQICFSYGGTTEDAMEKLEYDLYYIKNYSFMLDTVILIQTVEVIVFGQGAR